MKHNFGYMLKEYGLPYGLIVKTKGEYAPNGDHIEGDKVPMQRRGIILNFGRQELQYGTNGSYTTQDIKLFDNIHIDNGSIVVWEGNEYVVDEKDPWGNYSDFHVYICKKRMKKVVT